MTIKQKRTRWVLISALILFGLLFIAFLGLKKNISTKNMQQLGIQGFTMYYTDLEEETIRDMFWAVHFLRECYAEDYGIPRDLQTDIVVYTDATAFKRAYLGHIMAWMYRDTDWIVGGAYKDMLVVMSPEVDDGMHSYEDKLDILQHELIHVYNYHLNEMPDVFLDEGLAVYLSGQGEDERKPDGAMPTFDEMQSWNFEEFGENGGYYYSYRFCEFMESKVKLSGLLSLLETEDFEGITGMSYEENYNEWTEAESQ